MKKWITYSMLQSGAGALRSIRPVFELVMHRFCYPILVVVLGLQWPHAGLAATRPNVVLILTDNQGAWTLGCYGNPDIRTPNIDRLAKEGAMFTQAFASNPVCSPNRATLLTGLLPSQHGVHCFLRSGRLQIGPEARCTLDALTSLPEILKDAGYACGLIGKWHLGGNLRPQEGFDDYWVTMPHGGTSTFYNAQVIEDGQIRREPQYLTDFWTRHAVEFIESKAAPPETGTGALKDDRPFFLMLAYNGPYSLSRLLLREGRNRHAEYYADQDLSSFPREAIHPWQFNNTDYSNNPVASRRVATEISGIDDGVGTVLDALQRHGLEGDTIVIFTADQGWVGGQGGFFGMGDHTRPVTATDGMMRIPMIWRRPGKIPEGVVVDRMVANYDVLPTLLSQLGLGDRVPTAPKSPGTDFSQEWTPRPPPRDVDAAGDSSRPPQKPVFYEFEGLRCIRTERWKYIHRHPNGPHELYDLVTDPQESLNLIEHANYQTLRKRLKAQIDRFFGEYAVAKYDLWRGGRSQTEMLVGVDEPQTPRPPTAPPALSPGFSPAELNVPDGFTVELAAGPPLVEHPTFATFDDQGRLFVCENAGVNMKAEQLEEALPNSIRMLEDVDGDGRFDKSTVFADKMTFPMGGAWHDGALYVASPPNIWRLADVDGDGVADQREILVDRFGYTGNAASIHGCIAGPDGRLYWCDGYHGHEFKNEAGEIISSREGSYIFSCKPDGSDVRIHCGGGMDNPVEVDFSPAGEMIGTVNIFYTRPRVDCLVHWLYGGAYPHRERVLQELQVTGDLLEPIHRFGHVAISGMQRYRSGTMDRRWRDHYFATYFNSGKVVRLELERSGATFNVIQREFLTSATRQFHPTDLAEDADGSLLVVDTGGWFYRGCPTSQYAQPDVLGGIYRIRKQGMTPATDPRGLRILWPEQTHSQLVALLGDTRFVVRKRAAAECAKRGPDMLPFLTRAIQRRDGPIRLGAVWALTRWLGQEDSEVARAGIRHALEDRQWSIQLAACRSLATYPDSMALPKLLRLVQEEGSPAIRREAATALGRLGDPAAIPTLLNALDESTRHGSIDRAEEHAVLFALIEINDPVATRQGLSADKMSIRRAALIALDQMHAGDLKAEEVLTLLETQYAPLQLSAARVWERHPEWSERNPQVVRRLIASDLPTLATITQRLLKRALEDPNTRPQMDDLVLRQLTGMEGPEHREGMLQTLAATRNVTPHASWVPPLLDLLESGQVQTQQSVVAALSALGSEQFRQRLQDFGQDERNPAILRVAAMQSAADNRAQLRPDAFRLLLDLLDQGNQEESFMAARRIGEAILNGPQLQKLCPRLTEATSSELNELLKPFERVRTPDVAIQFLEAMERARGLKTLAPHRFSDVVKRFPQQVLPQANRLLQRIEQFEEDRIVKVDRLMPLLSAGNAQRGRKLFHSEKSKCATCHRTEKAGSLIGPDLSNIGANRSARDLLESVVLPSATIVRDYEPYTLVTLDGRVLSGVLARETEQAVYLQSATGPPVEILRSEIEQMLPSAVSMMPSGMDEALTENELADVIAYLKTLRQP